MLSSTMMRAPVRLTAMILQRRCRYRAQTGQANQIKAEPTRNRQRAAAPQGERRATRRQLQGTARSARSEASAGRMPRRGKHEEPQMSMEREREHLAQVDQP
jgi:hypothetical protein